MPKQNGAAHRIMEIVLEKVVFQPPDLTWNQIFLVVDHLSQSGKLRLIPKKPSV